MAADGAGPFRRLFRGIRPIEFGRVSVFQFPSRLVEAGYDSEVKLLEQAAVSYYSPYYSILPTNRNGPAALQAVRSIAQPPLVVGLLADRSSELIQAALRAGADDVFSLPPSSDDALRALLRAKEFRRRLKSGTLMRRSVSSTCMGAWALKEGPPHLVVNRYRSHDVIKLEQSRRHCICRYLPRCRWITRFLDKCRSRGSTSGTFRPVPALVDSRS